MFARSWGKISTAIGGLAFLQQVSGQDMTNAQNLPIGDKAKVLINSLTGRIFGIGVVPGSITFSIGYWKTLSRNLNSILCVPEIAGQSRLISS